MKKFLMLMAVVVLFSCENKMESATKPEVKLEATDLQKENLYQFKMTDLNGNDFDFSTLKGKKVMLVNTASKCGYTPQYKDLELLYKTYKDKGFTIIGFPANNFGKQEPGTNAEIAEFCEQNFGVSFPMMAKTSVKGDDINPIYKFLTQKSKNGLKDSEVAWNFQKYLIDENGHLVAMHLSKILPTDKTIVSWIENN